MSKDNINPDHYKKECSLECIEAMELIFGGRAVLDFCVCNAWKYIWRWKNKNGAEDLHKAHWYINQATITNQEYTTSMYEDIISRLNSYICSTLEIVEGLEADHEEESV